MRDDGGGLSRNTRKSVTRDKIMRAAIVHFAERGFEAASIQSIVEDAEVAHGTVFWHFGTKLALYVEVARWAAQQFHDAMRPEIEVEGLPPSMRLLAAKQFELLRDNPHIGRLALSLAVESTGAHPELQPAMVQFGRRVTEVWRLWARRSAEAGRLNPAWEPNDVGAMVAAALAGSSFGSQLAGVDARQQFESLAAILETGCLSDEQRAAA